MLLIWCLGTYDVICKKYIKIQQYCYNKDFDIINILGIRKNACWMNKRF